MLEKWEKVLELSAYGDTVPNGGTKILSACTWARKDHHMPTSKKTQLVIYTRNHILRASRINNWCYQVNKNETKLFVQHI